MGPFRDRSSVQQILLDLIHFPDSYNRVLPLSFELSQHRWMPQGMQSCFPLSVDQGLPLARKMSTMCPMLTLLNFVDPRTRTHLWIIRIQVYQDSPEALKGRGTVCMQHPFLPLSLSFIIFINYISAWINLESTRASKAYRYEMNDPFITLRENPPWNDFRSNRFI